jgi:hypothetical protein
MIQKGASGRPAKTSDPWRKNSKNPTSTRNTASKEKYAEWDKLMQQLFIRRKQVNDESSAREGTCGPIAKLLKRLEPLERLELS